MKKIIVQLVNGTKIQHIPAVEELYDVYMLIENTNNKNVDGCRIHKALSKWDYSGLRRELGRNYINDYPVYVPERTWDSIYFEAVTLSEEIKAALLEIKNDLEATSHPTTFALVSC